jgi:glycerol transport system ATP-binding protein
LKNRGVAKSAIAARVAEIAALLDLTPVFDRKATRLTADAKQKISLGRGLVRSDVAAVLFDEPLTVIDPELKWELRPKLKALHRALDLTMIYVTHDQTEALTFADTVVVMHEGEIVQIGTPEELFERPTHTFVGYFIGSPGMNVLPVQIEGTTAKLGRQQITLPYAVQPKFGARTELGIRPEYVRLGREGMPVSITKVEDIGRQKVVRALFEGKEIAAILGEDADVPADPHVSFDPKGINIYADNWRLEGRV